MTETEWLASDDIEAMLRLVGGRASDRKLRLFACGCCRQVWHLLTDEPSRNAVEVAERYADGLASDNDLLAAAEEAEAEEAEEAAAVAASGWAWARASAAWASAWAWASAAWVLARGTRPAAWARACISTQQAGLLRCIVGNPFRPAAVSPAWHTDTVRRLAESIYIDHAFDRLPILADALEEAGCQDVEMLAHLRGPGPHARGCWCVDLLLGKE